MKKKIIVLIASILLISGLTYLGGILLTINNQTLKVILNILINLLNGVVALIAMKLTNIKLNLNFKEKKQYLIGISIGLILSTCIIYIPLLFGINFVGPHETYSKLSLLYNFLFFMLIIGPVEELIFRVYLEETFISFFNKNKWISVIITSLLFGLWHLINGSFIQVLFTLGIGLVFGFSKYLIKNCTYLSVSIGHGLYDFLNVIARMFVI